MPRPPAGRHHLGRLLDGLGPARRRRLTADAPPRAVHRGALRPQRNRDGAARPARRPRHHRDPPRQPPPPLQPNGCMPGAPSAPRSERRPARSRQLPLRAPSPPSAATVYPSFTGAGRAPARGSMRVGWRGGRRPRRRKAYRPYRRLHPCVAWPTPGRPKRGTAGGPPPRAPRPGRPICPPVSIGPAISASVGQPFRSGGRGQSHWVRGRGSRLDRKGVAELTFVGIMPARVPLSAPGSPLHRRGLSGGIPGGALLRACEEGGNVLRECEEVLEMTRQDQVDLTRIDVEIGVDEEVAKAPDPAKAGREVAR